MTPDRRVTIHLSTPDSDQFLGSIEREINRQYAQDLRDFRRAQSLPWDLRDAALARITRRMRRRVPTRNAEAFLAALDQPLT